MFEIVSLVAALAQAPALPPKPPIPQEPPKEVTITVPFADINEYAKGLGQLPLNESLEPFNRLTAAVRGALQTPSSSEKKK
jgi:hypothetical protein